MTENERDKLREEIKDALRPAVDQVIADAVRPYKLINTWLWVTVAGLTVLSVVQWLV